MENEEVGIGAVWISPHTGKNLYCPAYLVIFADYHDGYYYCDYFDGEYRAYDHRAKWPDYKEKESIWQKLKKSMRS